MSNHQPRTMCGTCWQFTDNAKLGTLIDIHGHRWWICDNCINILWAVARPPMTDEEDKETETTDAERRIAEAVIKGLGKMLAKGKGDGESRS